MNPIFAAGAEIERFCDERRFRFCFIGGLAVQRWGEPRLTLDVDLTLLTGFGTELPFVESLLARFTARLPDARAFAMEHRVLLLTAGNGIPLDISFGAMPFEEHAIDRSSAFAVDDHTTLRTCSAEDLIVHKAFAGRDKDWLDVRGIIARRGAKLDTGLIWAELEPLLELRDADETSARLKTLLG